jgi:hypothetical protein
VNGHDSWGEMLRLGLGYAKPGCLPIVASHGAELNIDNIALAQTAESKALFRKETGSGADFSKNRMADMHWFQYYCVSVSVC